MKGKDDDILDGEFVDAELRSDFKDAIYWSPSVMTDASGYATVNVKFPDNLTTWRITSRVITEDTKVGQMTNTVITRKDLLVRMETPRFFQQRDEITIATIVHNYLETDKNTKFSLEGGKP
jgi:alpha-2-macroglobulin